MPRPWRREVDTRSASRFASITLVRRSFPVAPLKLIHPLGTGLMILPSTRMAKCFVRSSTRLNTTSLPRNCAWPGADCSNNGSIARTSLAYLPVALRVVNGLSIRTPRLTNRRTLRLPDHLRAQPPRPMPGDVQPTPTRPTSRLQALGTKSTDPSARRSTTVTCSNASLRSPTDIDDPARTTRCPATLSA